MRKFFLALTVCCAAVSLSAREPEVYDIEICISLSQDGSAQVTEMWDLSWNKTEWYLVRGNLGDIVISDLRVSDETGRSFVNEGNWDADRTLEQKAGRCGIVHKSDGCELCWGVGSAQRHQFTVQYRMSNLVKSADDYDYLHVQFVSPGIRPRPAHARVTISAEGKELSDGPVLVWSFGFHGTVGFDGGSIVADTDAPFSSDDESVIVLARFDKGLFTPTSIRGGSFDDVKENAFKGSDYKAFPDEQSDGGVSAKGMIGLIAAIILALAGYAGTQKRKRNRDMFGVVKLKEIGYERELPFGGGLMESRYVLNKCSTFSSEGHTACALILQMIKDGWLDILSDGSVKMKLAFVSKEGQTPDGCAGEFYNMLKDAAGSDGILEGREFSKWSSGHAEQLDNWIRKLNLEGARRIDERGFGKGTVFTAEGQKQARRVIGFRKFLKDFTLLKERGTKEVALWQDYMIFAALYDIADKVAKELSDIDPKAFEIYVGFPYATYSRLISMSGNIGASMTGAASSLQTASSVEGHGGISSFGGGGGFSGGGFGGGGR